MNVSATSSLHRPLLYKGEYLVLSIGPSNQLQPHSHGAAELRVSLDSLISCRVGDHQETAADSILIPPGVRHQNRCADPVSAVLYLDAESQDYERLAARMTSEGAIFIGLPNITQARLAVREIIRSVPSLEACLAGIRRDILGAPQTTRTIDPRVSSVLHRLKERPADRSAVRDLASSVNLSEDRLHHLFTTEVGIPIHRFRLWMRLKHASDIHLSGNTLTAAAHDAGFADAAHLTRTFVRMFGAPPSKLLTQYRHG